jgi:enterobacterial common antigen flippase
VPRGRDHGIGGRGELRATFLMGGASAVGMISGVVRYKAFAVLLGPAGIGIYGTLQTLQSLAISLADLGLTGAGTREIAAARQRGRAIADVQYVLVRLALLFGGVMGALVWLFRDLVSRLAFGSDEFAALIGVLGAGVVAAVVGGVASALLMGTHRVGALAGARIVASIAATIAGVGLVYFFREAGLGWALVSIPAFTLLFTWVAAGRMFAPPHQARSFWSRPEVRSILTFGGAAFGATVVGMAAQVVIRAVLIREHGLDAAGEYQAAWGISMLYCGLVLAALPADYFPRASALAGDREGLGRAALSQVRTSVGLLGLPILAVLLFAPFVVHLVYSPDFVRAGGVLRWQAVGDPLRVLWWILTATLLASGAIRTFVVVEVLWNACYLAAVIMLPRYVGFDGTGMALPASFVAVLPLALLLMVRVVPTRVVIRLTAMAGAVFLFAALLAVTLHSSEGLSTEVWIVATAGLAYTGWRLLATLRGSRIPFPDAKP